MTQRKVPLRRCMGCYESKPKKELVRVVKNNAGEVSLDTLGKKPGRGAYVCNSVQCLAKAQKARRIERVLECEITQQLYEELTSEIQKGDTGAG